MVGSPQKGHPDLKEYPSFSPQSALSPRQSPANLPPTPTPGPSSAAVELRGHQPSVLALRLQHLSGPRPRRLPNACRFWFGDLVGVQIQAKKKLGKLTTGPRKKQLASFDLPGSTSRLSHHIAPMSEYLAVSRNLRNPSFSFSRGAQAARICVFTPKQRGKRCEHRGLVGEAQVGCLGHGQLLTASYSPREQNKLGVQLGP